MPACEWRTLATLGHVPAEQAKAIGRIDVAMIPVGGFSRLTHGCA